jgi:hypothetical protein
MCSTNKTQEGVNLFAPLTCIRSATAGRTSAITEAAALWKGSLLSE